MNRTQRAMDEHLSKRIDKLADAVKAISDDLTVGYDRLTSLEANTAARISEDIDYIGDKPDYLSLEELVELTGCSLDDPLEGKEEAWAIAQCGEMATACRSCSPAMWNTTQVYPLTSGLEPCKHELTYADTVAYSESARRARADTGDTKYGIGDLKGLGGRTEGSSAEQVANMSDSRLLELWKRLFDDTDWQGFGLYTQAELDKLSASAHPVGSVAPAQAVYCCNGAKYEARQ